MVVIGGWEAGERVSRGDGVRVWDGVECVLFLGIPCMIETRCTIYVCTKGREPIVYNPTPDDEIINVRRQSLTTSL